jgi:mRNA interferase RelE/StbE
VTAYVVLLKRSAEKELDRLPGEVHARIVARLLGLRDAPRPSNAKKLRAREAYRVRVGEYRILYTIDDTDRRVEVFSIGHRRDVYR